jgi:anti-anti-sigma regulatory factor
LQQSTAVDETRFAVRASRRNGIDRLFLIGELDRTSVLVLERELLGVAHAGGAVILDLRDLTTIDRWGLRTLERAAQRAGPSAWRLSIINGRGLVLDAFEKAGIDHLLSGPSLPDLLDGGDGEWTAISPHLLAERATSPPSDSRGRP